MKKTELMKTVSRSLHKAGFKFKKHSPEILVVAGVVGVVGSAVMACRATTKLSGVLEESKEQLDQIHEYVETEGFSEKYTEEDSKKDLAIVYAKSALNVTKLYAPAVAVGAVSIAAILGGHNILRKRNIALAAAYTTIDKSFKDYRGRVVERFGKELDRELKYNIKAKEVEETVVDENGEEKTVKKTVNVVDPSMYSDYARFFDDTCVGWERNAEMNLMFLRRQQDYANELLKSRGHLFLNEVYDMLGIQRSTAGQVVGWVYDESDPFIDNFVDFGIYDLYNENSRNFVNGYEKSILLDFNVDGNILDLL